MVIEIEDKDLEKSVISNFAGFVDMQSSDEVYTYDAEFFVIFKELQKTTGRLGGDIFYHLLNKIFDRPE